MLSTVEWDCGTRRRHLHAVVVRPGRNHFRRNARMAARIAGVRLSRTPTFDDEAGEMRYFAQVGIQLMD